MKCPCFKHGKKWVLVAKQVKNGTYYIKHIVRYNLDLDSFHSFMHFFDM